MLDNDSTTSTGNTDIPEPADRPVAAEPAAAAAAAPRRSVPPKRIRVAALAKELGVSSRELLTIIVDLGEGPKTASSALSEEQAARVRAAQQAPSEPARAPEPAAEPVAEPVAEPAAEPAAEPVAGPPAEPAVGEPADESSPSDAAPAAVLFVAPAPEAAPSPTRRRRRGASAPAGPPPAASSETDAEIASAGPDVASAEDAEDATAEPEDVKEAAEAEATGAARRRRRRGRRGRGGGQRSETEAETEGGATETAETGPDADADSDTSDAAPAEEPSEEEGEGTSPSTRRRRRRRRSSSGGGSETAAEDDPPNTVTHIRETKDTDDGVKAVKGSTRLEARRQRRRDGRETNRRRPPILTEAEFLARREAVDRVMAVRQHGDRTQIAVLEDDILVEHYVTRATATSYVGNVYLGRVQNVLPSMEAAFIDIGKGRNGVLYAGEVNWDAAGLEGKSRAIEQALKAGDAVLVQVTKDPIGHKGARLTSQISLPGRFLVYVPGGGMTGISRRLPDTERHRLKSVLKKIVPEDAGVIVRTAAEGASEADLTHDVERLQAEWAAIQKQAEKTSAAPTLVHGEPDLAIRVVRDVFNEDFKKLIVQGADAWQTVSGYVQGVAPELAERVSQYTGEGDVFHDLRVDEQIMKALDRKVWLPSGGSLVIDRTEAMTVIDVNTGKFVGAGGNLEQTVTRNNLEAAEEIVRQLRLRDVGGIVVIDFIDMVLESNRELVLRRLTECLARDRTKHQVAEVTSLGLVQMTRKRVGEGLLEAFSETCEVCHGRGVIIHGEPVDKGSDGGHQPEEEPKSKSRRRRGKRSEAAANAEPPAQISREQRTKALAAMTAIHKAANSDDLPDGVLEGDELADELDVEAADVDEVGYEPEADELDVEPVDVEPVDVETADVETVDVEIADVETADVETADVEPVDVEIADVEEPEVEAAQVGAVSDTEPEPLPQSPVEPEPVPAAAAEPESSETVTSRPRRRRRGASRPAGPPSAT